MRLDKETYLAHYGVLRKSGRYPWGSSNNQTTRHKDFLSTIDGLRKQGLSDKTIADSFKLKINEIRNAETIAKNEIKLNNIHTANRLAAKGMSGSAIAKQMGLPGESSVRALRAEGLRERAEVLTAVSEMLKGEVALNRFIDVGKGNENYIKVARNKLDSALFKLTEEGYSVHKVKIPNPGTNYETTTKVLIGPNDTYKDLMLNKGSIRLITSVSNDNGKTFEGLYGYAKILPVNPNRILVNYAETGGTQADGVVYVRPGVKDISLGNNQYAQVRIAVGKDRYIKGMAVYKDDLPPGVDLQFNTNKSNKTPKMDVFKKQTEDPDNPFGAAIDRQIFRVDKEGNKIATSAMNIVRGEGQWDSWNKTLSSQMLSKQTPRLAKEQLDLKVQSKQAEFDRINSLTNPAVRKKLLKEFSDGADAAAVHLDAARMSRQETRVLMPVSGMKPSEVYAPTFLPGEKVVLIRFPHGGTFEIPELIVNNKNPHAIKLLGKNAEDAIGIHPSVAERLSGADFDGDTVLVIPNNRGRILTTPALRALKNFDHRAEYKGYPGMKPINTQTEMGKITNLITDMTILDAPPDHIARAIKHSMVVIDSENHNLDYKRSAEDNGINALKLKYQGKESGGAATIISRAGADHRIPKRRDARVSEGGAINPITGKRQYTVIGKEYVVSNVSKTGKITNKTKVEKEVVDWLSVVDDAHELVSNFRTPIEKVYANHSNKLKAMANKARLEMINTPLAPFSPSAKKTYAPQIKRLNEALHVAQMNAPLERQANVLTDAVFKLKKADNPEMTKKQQRRVQQQVLQEMRVRTGAKKAEIVISPIEWEAIQAGALHDSRLSEILNHADMEVVRELATPRQKKLMGSTETSRAKHLLGLGYTRSEVAADLGVSLSTLDNATGV